MKKNGFTLVELSIVLVIIGLLIGGILVAQSMIRSTKIQAFVRQLGQFDAAVENFYTTYGELPGDSAKFDSAVGNSDDSINCASDTFDQECPYFWPQLSAVGLKSETGANYVPTYANTFPFSAPNAPKAKIGTNSGVIVRSSNDDYGKVVNVYYIGNWTASTAADTIHLDNSISGPDALAVDTKIDDGNGTTGNVQGATTSGVADFSDDWGIFHEGLATNYDTSITTDNATILRIRIGTSTGSLK